MNKVKSLFKNNFKLVLGIVIGLVIAGGSFVVYAITATSITYKDNYGIGATTVQGAIDKLYEKANKPGAKTNKVYYAYGIPTTSSTTNYTTLGKKVFVALNGGQKSLCIIRNSRLQCFDINNWAIEKEHIQQVFSDISCTVSSSRVDCGASDFSCIINSDGSMACLGYNSGGYCVIYGDGSLECT